MRICCRRPSQIQIEALVDAEDLALRVVDLHRGAGVGVGHRHVLLLEVDVDGHLRVLEGARALPRSPLSVDLGEQAAVRPEETQDAVEVADDVALGAEFRLFEVVLGYGTEGLAELAEDVDQEHDVIGWSWSGKRLIEAAKNVAMLLDSSL
jgi:hypothetical protein